MDLTTAVNSLGNDYINKVSDLLTNNSVTKTDTSGNSTFDSVFNSVSGLLDSTNSYIQQRSGASEPTPRPRQAEVDYALGNMTNTHELGVYQQKANIALQYTVAIRDKALEAYKEIMNMQI